MKLRIIGRKDLNELADPLFKDLIISPVGMRSLYEAKREDNDNRKWEHIKQKFIEENNFYSYGKMDSGKMWIWVDEFNTVNLPEGGGKRRKKSKKRRKSKRKSKHRKSTKRRSKRR